MLTVKSTLIEYKNTNPHIRSCTTLFKKVNLYICSYVSILYRALAYVTFVAEEETELHRCQQAALWEPTLPMAAENAQQYSCLVALQSKTPLRSTTHPLAYPSTVDVAQTLIVLLLPFILRVHLIMMPRNRSPPPPPPPFFRKDRCTHFPRPGNRIRTRQLNQLNIVLEGFLSQLLQIFSHAFPLTVLLV